MTSVMKSAVAALIRNEDQILLIQQQAPENPAPNWALPGGVVEPGELLPSALAREIREETGLTLNDPGSLLYTAQIDRPAALESWLAFIFEVTDWTGDLAPDDPDGFILDAQFLPPADAIDKLENHLPFRPMREPILAYLRGETGPGALWCYRDEPDRGVRLIECIR